MIDLTQFVLAGKATFTAVSKKTGNRFTFRVRQPKENTPHFVSLMNGPDNTSSYQFMGTIFEGKNYRPGRHSKISKNALSSQAFVWLWNHRNSPDLDDKVEIKHAGKCCRCGRLLTTPLSIDDGIGPICKQITGLC